jgi:hypothetical protein
MTIWSILRPFGIFYGHLVYFPPSWYVAQRKIWQPWGVTVGSSQKRCFADFQNVDRQNVEIQTLDIKIETSSIDLPLPNLRGHYLKLAAGT